MDKYSQAARDFDASTIVDGQKEIKVGVADDPREYEEYWDEYERREIDAWAMRWNIMQ